MSEDIAELIEQVREVIDQWHYGDYGCEYCGRFIECDDTNCIIEHADWCAYSQLARIVGASMTDIWKRGDRK